MTRARDMHSAKYSDISIVKLCEAERLVPIFQEHTKLPEGIFFFKIGLTYFQSPTEMCFSEFCITVTIVVLFYLRLYLVFFFFFTLAMGRRKMSWKFKEISCTNINRLQCILSLLLFLSSIYRIIYR